MHERAGATRQSQLGFTFTETVIAGFMIIAALAVSAQLLIRPLEAASTVSPRALAQQSALYLMQDEAEQIAGAIDATPVADPTPLPMPSSANPAMHVGLVDETALATAASAGNTTVRLNSCANITAGNTIWFADSTNETRTVSSVAAGTTSTSDMMPQCTVTLSAAMGSNHATVGTPVLPANAARNLYGRYLTVLVTYPRLGATLVAAANSSATQVVVYDSRDFAVGRRMRIHTRANQTGGADQSAVYQITAVTGNTVMFTPGLGAASASGAMVAVGTLTTSTSPPTKDRRCLTVSDVSLFATISATGMPQAIQIDTGTSMESAAVSCVGVSCTCDNGSATAQTLLLARPLRKTHGSSVVAVPAIFSAGSFSVVLTTGGLGLGV